MAGGTERYVGDLARAQAAAGREVTVVTLDRDVLGVVLGRLPRREVDRGVRIVRLPGLGSGRFGVTFRPDVLLRIVRRSDMTHIHDIRFMLGTVAIANRFRGRPTILHTHGLIYGTRAFWRLKRFLSRIYYEPLIAATVSRVVCSSHADAGRLRAFTPRLADKASIIENGVDLGPFWRVERSATPGRLIVVGRVTRLKGIDRLLRALPHVSAPWSLAVHGAGEGDEPARLQTIARSLGIADRVEFAGAYGTEEEPGLFATPAAAIFPSTSEAMGMALVDAMAAGVPVLASDIPAHRDLLGEVASDCLIDFDRPEVVAAAIDRLLGAAGPETTTLRAALRNRARQFDVGRLVGELDDLYRSLGV
jgi:alpha-1,3-mannosyltransferase